MPGVAAGQSFQGHYKTLEKAIFFEGLNAILGTGGIVPARGGKYG